MYSLVIRPALLGDAPALASLYNHYVETSTCTFQLDAETVDERIAWIQQHTGPHPASVAILDGTIAGFASLSPFHGRCAYRATAESSVYVREDLHRKGIGRALMTELIEEARTLGHHTLIATIEASQEGSIALHSAFGFAVVGHLTEVGFKHGRWLDVVYLQLLL